MYRLIFRHLRQRYQNKENELLVRTLFQKDNKRIPRIVPDVAK